MCLSLFLCMCIGSARISQVVCGRHHTAFLTDQGSIYCWGATSFGRLGLPDPKKVVTTPTEVRLCSGGRGSRVGWAEYYTLRIEQGYIDPPSPCL